MATEEQLRAEVNRLEIRRGELRAERDQLLALLREVSTELTYYRVFVVTKLKINPDAVPRYDLLRQRVSEACHAK